MSRAVVIIQTPADRQKVAKWAANVEAGTKVEFRKKTRSIDQNALLWSCLGEISRQVDWYGQKLSAEDWKDVFSASLRRATSFSRSERTAAIFCWIRFCSSAAHAPPAFSIS